MDGPRDLEQSGIGRAPAASRRLRRRAHLRRRDARRPGGSPSVATWREARWRRCSNAACRCSASASARSCSRRRPAPAPAGESARDRLARRHRDRGGSGRPAARPARPALRGLPVAQLRVPAAARRDAARPQRTSAFRPTGSATARGASSSTPRSRRADAEAWIDDYRSDEDAVRIGLDPDALRAAHGRARSTPGTSSAAALCERFLDVVATRA